MHLHIQLTEVIERTTTRPRRRPKHVEFHLGHVPARMLDRCGSQWFGRDHIDSEPSKAWKRDMRQKTRSVADVQERGHWRTNSSTRIYTNRTTWPTTHRAFCLSQARLCNCFRVNNFQATHSRHPRNSKMEVGCILVSLRWRNAVFRPLFALCLRFDIDIDF